MENQVRSGQQNISAEYYSVIGEIEEAKYEFFSKCLRVEDLEQTLDLDDGPETSRTKDFKIKPISGPGQG